MKVLLVTIAIGEQYLQQYNMLFRESQAKYAFNHGYDFKVITDFLDKNNQYTSTISFNKILVCSQPWSNNYDFIIFVDADVYININSPPIHNYVDYEDLIGVIDEYDQPSKEKRLAIQKIMNWEISAPEYYKLCDLNIQTHMVFNTGLLVLQPRKHRIFLETIYNKYIKRSITHKRRFHFEQSCIGYEIQKSGVYKIIDNRFNALWGLTKILNTHNISLHDFCRQNYFIHFAGHVDLDKVPYLQNI